MYHPLDALFDLQRSLEARLDSDWLRGSTGGTGATGQFDSFARQVLLADTGTVAVDSVNRQVLLTDTGVLQVNGVTMEVMMTNPSSLQVGGAFAEVLRSTTIWTPLPAVRKNRTYVIR